MSDLYKIINDAANEAKEARENGYTGFPCSNSNCNTHNTTQIDGFSHGTGIGSVWSCNKCGNIFERRT